MNIKKRRAAFIPALFIFLCALSAPGIFAQTGPSALRNYVGLINQTYHPDIVAMFEKMKKEMKKYDEDGEEIIRQIDILLRGSTGTGFLYKADGTMYVLTNNHVVSQAYTLSISFDRADGEKAVFKNLKILAVDADTDLALLEFAPEDKPPENGLEFLEGSIEEGEDVYSAGFPGVDIANVWQFGKGIISNASAKFPKSFEDPTEMGPYIQHTAEVDPGNSGGPLLVEDKKAPSGFFVAGINTLKILGRQAANFAIPVDRIHPFLEKALHQKKEQFRADLDKRLSQFTADIAADKDVCKKISAYLSAACIGENAEYSDMVFWRKAKKQEKQSYIDNQLENGIISGLGYAVSWVLIDSIRKNTSFSLRASVGDVKESGDDYDVTLTVNGKGYASKWVREYENWRIKTFGDLLAGDKGLVRKLEAQRETYARSSFSFVQLEAGYAHLIGYSGQQSCLSAEAILLNTLGFQVYVNKEFSEFDIYLNLALPIMFDSFSVTPYATIGTGFVNDSRVIMEAKMNLQMGSKIGIKLLIASIPWAFADVSMQFNYFAPAEVSSRTRNLYKTKALSATIGVSF